MHAFVHDLSYYSEYSVCILSVAASESISKEDYQLNWAQQVLYWSLQSMVLFNKVNVGRAIVLLLKPLHNMASISLIPREGIRFESWSVQLFLSRWAAMINADP